RIGIANGEQLRTVASHRAHLATSTHGCVSRQLGEDTYLPDQVALGHSPDQHFAVCGVDLNLQVAIENEVGAVAALALADENLLCADVNLLPELNQALDRGRGQSAQ